MLPVDGLGELDLSPAGDASVFARAPVCELGLFAGGLVPLP